MPTNPLKNSVTVGSADEADIVIAEPTVSRLHCRFDWNSTHWILYDLNSTNGTFVNSRRIASPTSLRPEDKVTLGRGVPCAVPQAPSPTSVSKPTVARPAPTATVAQKQKKRAPTLWAYVIPTLSLAALFLMIAFISKGFGGASSQNTSQPAVSKMDAESIADVPGSSTVAAKQPGSNQSQSSLPNTQSAMYLAVVESADRRDQKLLGTAIAVESKKLIISWAGRPLARTTRTTSFSLMFFKRLCDQWEHEADEAIAEQERQQGKPFTEKQKRAFSTALGHCAGIERFDQLCLGKHRIGRWRNAFFLRPVKTFGRRHATARRPALFGTIAAARAVLARVRNLGVRFGNIRG